MANKKPVYLPRVTWETLCNDIDRRKGATVPDTSEDHSFSNSDEWAGGSFEQARRWARFGWVDGVSRASAILAGAQGMESQPAWELDVSGYFPLVPAYVAGEPECMMSRIQEDSPRQRLALAVSLVYHAGIEAEQVLCYAAAISVVLAEIEASGTDVAMYGIDNGESRHDKVPAIYYGVPVREFGDPLDMSRLVYAFHPTFLRRVLFAHRELDPVLSAHWLARNGYGAVRDVTAADVAACVGGVGITPVNMPSVQDMAGRGLLVEHRHADCVEALRACVREAVKQAA